MAHAHAIQPGLAPVVVKSLLDPRSAPLSGLPRAPRLFQGVGAAYSSLAIRAPESAARSHARGAPTLIANTSSRQCEALSVAAERSYGQRRGRHDGAGR